MNNVDFQRVFENDDKKNGAAFKKKLGRKKKTKSVGMGKKKRGKGRGKGRGKKGKGKKRGKGSSVKRGKGKRRMGKGKRRVSKGRGGRRKKKMAGSLQPAGGDLGKRTTASVLMSKLAESAGTKLTDPLSLYLSQKRKGV